MTTYSDEVVCAPRAGTLYDVLELILDRGMVIDIFVRVSLVGIEILKIDARIVVASVDTYLRFAEACNRLDLEHDSRTTTVPELFGEGMGGRVAKAGAKRTARSIGDKVKGALGQGHDDDDDDDYEEQEEERESRASRRRPSSRTRESGSRERSTSSRTRRRTEED
ncbi:MULTISPECIES: gas vesicle structural protein GvpA [unclassified Streptomyces]|uniref:gas vesicle structural protein GvpA n=1 Tax=unclassified Streptomyces TaxID=2593676 RepID=UPI0028C3E188|nr:MULTISPECIES: gas vesicle structural protein GvpA [unclassified Streptomyces]WNO76531.1 gas vesicle structural protein GvpA [Streptomyces sp. AM8-1-1]